MYRFHLLPDYYVACCPEDGPYTALRYSVGCDLADGRNWAHFKTYSSEWDADQLLQRITANLPEDWSPVENPHWYPLPHTYGSEAYCRSGQWLDEQKLDVEAEFGPGSYRPGGPGFVG